MKCGLDKIYRPEWTCGRYDEKHQVAIYYNLIEGMAYFFEDESASVIGEILHLGRNGNISIGLLSKKVCLSEENLKPFLVELEQINLITTFLPSQTTIEIYRRDFRASFPIYPDYYFSGNHSGIFLTESGSVFFCQSGVL